jgi:hypothetical protein
MKLNVVFEHEPQPPFMFPKETTTLNVDVAPMNIRGGVGSSNEKSKSLSLGKISIECMGGVCSSKEKTIVAPLKKTMIEATPQKCPPPFQSAKGEDWVVLKARSTPTKKLFKHKFPSKSIVVQISWVFWCVV